MGNASDRTMPKKAYAKCVANETVSHKKLVKKVTEHLRFFPHGMMEAVLEEVFNRLILDLAVFSELILRKVPLVLIVIYKYITPVSLSA